MIKKIHCLGTSHTRGGGFQLEEKVKEIYKNVVDNPSMDTLSWPGILQRLVGDDIKVFNLAESGAGNERMYRLAFDVITNPNFKKEENLLLLEISTLGRKEYYSNTINDYVICNYVPTNPPGDNFDVVWKYYNNDKPVPNKIKKIYSDFLLETVNFDDLVKKLQMNVMFFLSFLKSNDINFIVVNYERFLSPEQEKFGDIKSLEYFIEGKRVPSFYSKIVFDNFLITEETDRIIKDAHQGYFVNNIVSKTIFNNLVESGMIPGQILNIENTKNDFLKFKKTLILKRDFL